MYTYYLPGVHLYAWLDLFFTWLFTWCGHTKQRSVDSSPAGWSHRICRTYWSMKKSIRVIRSLPRLFLKEFTETASTDSWGREFHRLITLSQKKCFLMLQLDRFLINFFEWPRVLRDPSTTNMDSSTGEDDTPLRILNTSIRSALLRRSSRVHSPSRWRRSPYDSFESPGIILVNRCWTLSRRTLSILYWGLQADTAYSRWGRTIVL